MAISIATKGFAAPVIVEVLLVAGLKPAFSMVSREWLRESVPKLSAGAGGGFVGALLVAQRTRGTGNDGTPRVSHQAFERGAVLGAVGGDE